MIFTERYPYRTPDQVYTNEKDYDSVNKRSSKTWYWHFYWHHDFNDMTQPDLQNVQYVQIWTNERLHVSNVANFIQMNL